MREHFEHSLSDLHIEIIKMGSLVENAILSSIKAFKNFDLELCAAIIDGDRQINEMERRIESMCLWLIAKEQPIATDLRNIMTALKMITDMERIADNSSDIAEITTRIAQKNVFADSGHILKMANVAASMVRDSVSSFVNSDMELAEKTIKRDDEVDEFFNIIKQEISEIFRSGDKDIDNAIDLLLITKYLERIADHAVNICEWVEFSKTGTRKNSKIF